MPAWLQLAISMLAQAGFTAAQIGALPGLTTATAAIAAVGLEHKHRRRRKRALTASDRADIGFIVGLLGPKAGERFSVTLAGRSR